MIISISRLKKRSADRTEGYLEDVLASGVVIGDQLQITVEEFNRLKKKYSPVSPRAKCNCCNQVK